MLSILPDFRETLARLLISNTEPGQARNVPARSRQTFGIAY
jgi:hypothetical protein